MLAGLKWIGISCLLKILTSFSDVPGDTRNDSVVTFFCLLWIFSEVLTKTSLFPLSPVLSFSPCWRNPPASFPFGVECYRPEELGYWLSAPSWCILGSPSMHTMDSLGSSQHCKVLSMAFSLSTFCRYSITFFLLLLVGSVSCRC